ncbi:unnamed protein product [Caenorhabditis brenneri]
MSSLLEMMPDVVMKKILEECGLVAIQRLRKTCRTLRNWIGDFQPDPLISAVTILLESKEITLRIVSSSSEDTVNLIYQKTPDGTLLRNCSIGWEHYKILDKMDYSHSIMAILPFLDEKSIENLNFLDAIGTWGRELDIENIVELPHWNSAREISISKFSVSAPIQKFFHFKNGSIYLKSISTDDIILMKNNSLKSLNFVRFEVYLSVKNNEYQGFFIDKYGLPYFDKKYWTKNAAWFFKKDNETVLKMLINSDTVLFERVGKESVPEGVLILE